MDLCWQHEHQRLLKASEQAQMSMPGSARRPCRRAYHRQAFAAAGQVAADLARIEELGRADAARVEDARYVLRTIDAVDPREGEYEQLLAAAERAEHAEAIAQGLAGAASALSDEGGALEQVGAAAEALAGIGRFDERYANLAQSVREAGYILEDAARDLSSLRDDDEAFDLQALEQLQERVAAYQGLRRAYGPTMDEVFAAREQAAEVVAAVDSHDEQVQAARARQAQAEEQLAQAADAYRQVRAKAAPGFTAQVDAVLDELEMGGAQLVCQVEPLERAQWTAAGPAVEFLFAAGAGLAPRPLRRIASGGEISRVMLAVKAVLGQADGVDTLVFDEVDAGVGGKTALAVASVLRRLARTHQVICVTHLPQVAVAGDAHYLVQKEEKAGDGLPQTRLERLEGPARIDEVARMLGGEVTETSRSHAAELLAHAHGKEGR